MNTNARTLRVLWLMLLIPAVASAVITPVLDIPDLAAKSDVIALGLVTSIADAGPASVTLPNAVVAGRTMAAVMLVDRVLKGPQDLRELRFQFVQTDEFIGYPTVAQDSYRLIFLKQAAADYVFTSPYHPSLIAVPDTAVSATNVVDAVYQVLGAVLRNPKASTNDKREAIHSMFPGRTPNAEVIKILRTVLQDPEPSMKDAAAAVLLNSNDVSALPLAEEVLLRPASGFPSEAVLNLRGGIANGIKDPAAIPTLKRLMQSPDVETRRAVAGALRHTQSTSAIEPLGKALDDPDVDVRYSAVAGLAEITGQTDHMPSIPLFRTNPEKFVAWWKEWLARQ